MFRPHPAPDQQTSDTCEEADKCGIVFYTMLFPSMRLHLTPPFPLLSNLSVDPAGLASLSEQRVAWSPRPALAVRLFPLVIH